MSLSSSGPSLEKAFTLLKHANQLEDEGIFGEACEKYQDAIDVMRNHVQQMDKQDNNTFHDLELRATKRLLLDKIKHYEDHSRNLSTEKKKNSTKMEFRIAVDGNSNAEDESPPEGMKQKYNDAMIIGADDNIDSWEQAAREQAAKSSAYLSVALNLDESGQKQAAMDKYLSAAEALLPAIKLIVQAEKSDDHQNPNKKQSCNKLAMSSTLSEQLKCIMDRVEQLKLLCVKNSRERPRSVPHFTKERSMERQQTTTATASSYPTTKLSPEEIAVLKRSSLIASSLFLPWIDNEVRAFNFTNNGKSWTDPEGVLKLSPPQTEKFHAWKRPCEIIAMRGTSTSDSTSQPKPFIIMVQSITPFTIRQRAVTDCSFIARRFGRRLVTSLIFPQDNNGIPIYNKYGIYMVKLWLNGIARRVLVDDFLPVDKHGTLLCSHTAGSDMDGGLELWVPIIEKAYMKLCGGYDFPGSNSGVDLFSLTGWIPERIYLAEDDQHVKDFETPRERAWERLYHASNLGDCLITVATGSNLAEDTAKDIGLVTGHAYAVLCVLKTNTGIRLLQLKNPWAHQSWKGRFSYHDRLSWADNKLQLEVGYDPLKASNCDDGVFWICWEDIVIYFSNIYLSWNPALFSSKVTVHGFWPGTLGPADDSYNVSENPQYILTMSDAAIQSKSSLWILLSRHVDKQEQEGAKARDFLTPFIHRNSSNADLILYPSSKTCVLVGAYSNNPHILVRYDIQGPEDKFLSVVLSQHQKAKDLGYTLSCFCTRSFVLSRPIKTPTHAIELWSEWTESTAGGNPSNASFTSNPMWYVVIPNGGAQIQLKCSAPKTITINAMLVKAVSGRSNVKSKLTLNSSTIEIDTGDYRNGFTASAVKSIVDGSYILVASTFYPGQVGTYMLAIHSSEKGVNISKL